MCALPKVASPLSDELYGDLTSLAVRAEFRREPRDTTLGPIISESTLAAFHLSRWRPASIVSELHDARAVVFALGR